VISITGTAGDVISTIGTVITGTAITKTSDDVVLITGTDAGVVSITSAAVTAIVAVTASARHNRNGDNYYYYSSIDAIAAGTSNKRASIPAITASAAKNDYDDATEDSESYKANVKGSI
jgi:hypothetical protein